MKEATLIVDGMSCGHCKMKVTKTLSGLEGVQSVDINLETREVKVKFDASKVSQDTLEGAITEIGYDVVRG